MRYKNRSIIIIFFAVQIPISISNHNSSTDCGVMGRTPVELRCNQPYKVSPLQFVLTTSISTVLVLVQVLVRYVVPVLRNNQVLLNSAYSNYSVFSGRVGQE